MSDKPLMGFAALSDNSGFTQEQAMQAISDFGQLQSALEENDRLKALNAELVEALESIVKSLTDHDDEGMIEHAAPMLKARAALAKSRQQ